MFEFQLTVLRSSVNCTTLRALLTLWLCFLTGCAEKDVYSHLDGVNLSIDKVAEI